NPEQLAMAQNDASNWDAVFDEAIRWVAPIGMYSRQTTRDTALQGIFLPAGAQLGICLLSANRDHNYWSESDAFALTRTDAGAHLACCQVVHGSLGRAKHVCEGRR